MIVDRVRRRFSDLELLAQSPVGHEIPPVTLFNALPNHPALQQQMDRSILFSEGTRVLVPEIDGYHRIFSSYVSGRQYVPALCLWDTESEPFKELTKQYPELYEESLNICLDLNCARSEIQPPT